jgi:hypothetical protein
MAVLHGLPRSARVSQPALEIHVRAVASSVRTDCPVFISDDTLDEIAPAHLNTIAALELCLAGLWDRASGGYVISDLHLIERLSGRRRVATVLRRWWAALNRDNFIPF